MEIEALTELHACRFAAVMIAGLALSATITPETCEKASGKSLELKDLAYRKMREQKIALLNESSPGARDA